jgi:hypothetical protein
MKRLSGNVASVLVPLLAALELGHAAQLKEARVTQIVSDVKLLPEQAAPRPAAVNDAVRPGTAVRTGIQSRSELTFTDLTITRLGANTIFSFDEGSRTMNLRDGAILFQVPKGSGGATIKTPAVSAAITGTTGIGEYHPARAGHPKPFSKWLCLEGTFHLILPNGESVELTPGKLVTTDGDHFSKTLDFNIGQVMATSLLTSGFDTPLASLHLIEIEQQDQLGPINRTPITNKPNFFDPTNIIDVVDQGMVAQASPSPTESPTPPITPTPSTPTPTPTPSKFGELTVIASSDPYTITNGTTISTDPTITTNGQTDFGKIYRGPAEDGPLSEFLFGSTSAFDAMVNFDHDLNIDMAGAVFKFTSLQLTGDPSISTAGGPMNLGLIAVNEITSGGPGGVLTFAGIRGLVLATQHGSINLGPEISFSGLHDIVFYARGSSSILTLASDVSTTNRIGLFGEAGIQLSSNLSTLDLFVFTTGDFDFTAGSIDANDIAINAGGNVHFTLGTPLSFETTAFLLEAHGNINIDNSLEVTEESASQAARLNVTLVAGQSLSVGGDLKLTTDINNVSDGGNLTVTSGADTTIGGALTLLVDNSNAGQIGVGGNILFTAGGDLTADSIDAFINNRNGGMIDSGSSVIFDIGGALTTTGDSSFVISNRNDGAGGGTMGSNVTLTLNAASASVGSLAASISTNAGGAIAGDALDNVTIAGALATPGFLEVDIQNTGFNFFGGPFIASGDIGGNAILNLTAGSIATGDVISVEIDNNGAGHIGGDALLNAAISNNITTSSSNVTAPASDAFFVIRNTAEMDGDSLIDGGTIDGNAAVNFSAGNVSIQGFVEVDVLNNDERFLNAGGDIGGDADVVFSAANVSSTGFFNLLINNERGSIGGGSSIDANAANFSTGDSFFAHILNENGQIGGDAAVSVLTPGSIETELDTVFEIANPDGAIGEDATLNITAANVATGRSLFALIDNTGDASIGGNATIDMNISGDATIASNATIQIFGNDVGKAAAININGGNYEVTGTFFSTIDGNGTLGFNNTRVHADVLKAGVFGPNGVVNIGGGMLTADTTLKLYAPGSGGELNFISNVTLGGNSAKILAANSITIMNGVVVTIGGTAPADVFTNNANYAESSGGNDSTTGTFAGAGANAPQPLDQMPPFDNVRAAPSPAPASKSTRESGNRRPPLANRITPRHRIDRSVKIASKKAPNPTIKIGDSGELLSLLDRATPGSGKQLVVPRSSRQNNAARTNSGGRANAQRGGVSVPRTAARLPQ